MSILAKRSLSASVVAAFPEQDRSDPWWLVFAFVATSENQSLRYGAVLAKPVISHLITLCCATGQVLI